MRKEGEDAEVGATGEMSDGTSVVEAMVEDSTTVIVVHHRIAGLFVVAVQGIESHPWDGLS